jgi:uncharacterized protein YceK
MRKISVITISIIITAVLLLTGCSSNVNVVFSDATTFMTYSSEKYIWEQINQNHEGTINIQGIDYYYRLVDEDDEEVFFQGVNFILDYASYLISQGKFIYIPYTYFVLAEFEDGTSETLVHASLLYEQEIYIGISDHDNPHTGIIQIHDMNTNETTMYLLVSLAG